MQQKSWTFTAFENGEADRVATGLSTAQALRAIERATLGLDPFEGEPAALRAVAAERAERKLPVAA